MVISINFLDKYTTGRCTTQSPPQAPLGFRFCTGGLGGKAPQQILQTFLYIFPPLFFWKSINKGGIFVVIWTDCWVFWQKCYLVELFDERVKSFGLFFIREASLWKSILSTSKIYIKCIVSFISRTSKTTTIPSCWNQNQSKS